MVPLRGYQEGILEVIPSTIIVVNRSLEVLYANRNYYVKSGKMGGRGVIGERLNRVFPQSLMETTRINSKIQEVLSTGHPSEGHQLKYPGGSFYFYKIYPLKSPEGDVSKVAIFMEDVTELTRLEEELRDSYIQLENAYSELKEIDHTKSEFITTVSHELRTPLTVINSYLEMFEDGMLGDLTGVQRQKLRVIRSQIDHMIGLVQDMLDTSRLESSKFAIKREQIKLEDIARSTVEELRRLATLKEHTVFLEVEDLPVLGVDGQSIKRVFNNLLTNAIKYTPDRGTIKVSMRDQGEEVLVSISDTGVGIMERDMERIFDRFYTGVEGSLALGSGRMGLGLAIAKGIVEAHGGRIWVDSKPNLGSTFNFTLPKGGRGYRSEGVGVDQRHTV